MNVYIVQHICVYIYMQVCTRACTRTSCTNIYNYVHEKIRTNQRKTNRNVMTCTFSFNIYFYRKNIFFWSLVFFFIILRLLDSIVQWNEIQITNLKPSYLVSSLIKMIKSYWSSFILKIILGSERMFT